MKGKDLKLLIKIHNLKNSKSVVLKLTTLSISIMFGFFSILIFLLVFTIFTSFKFAFLYLENITLKRQNQSLRKYISQIEEEINIVKNKLKDIFELSNNFRIIAGINPIPQDIKYFGIGGYIQTNDSISNLKFEINNIKRLLELEMKNIKEVESILIKKRDELSRIPSILPARGIIVSNFGYRNDPFTGEWKMHEGIDISAPIGTPVYASADGTVIFAGYKEGYGLCIDISHGNGIITRYAHLSRILVSVGQKVKRSEIIGKVGSTGRSTGSHLHYEIIVNGTPKNPLNYIILSDVVYD
ncbi:MAG: peptidoglycan DD-metalloendopeptidase family protein [candidate division WOR-3 bacterium]|nr:peptidoglycan DD-metalloendopeptidase family protein [candidate division WOR-3 bacterium]MCX7947338.1 peptidoglycan DD-metalloendopeptidase family protein [candidate division WOR-3 bacterium]MDW8150106.1 peptidoglycan DD-metalloendopeptidase family protein [candidate division WOR-3 bacterium]